MADRFILRAQFFSDEKILLRRIGKIEISQTYFVACKNVAFCVLVPNAGIIRYKFPYVLLLKPYRPELIRGKLLFRQLGKFSLCPFPYNIAVLHVNSPVNQIRKIP